MNGNQPKSFQITTIWKLFLFVLLLAGLGLRLHGIFNVKEGLSMDESVSYMCSAATQGRYEIEKDAWPGQVLPAAHIQGFYASPDHIDLRTVAYDMAHVDIHPPLYFWCLHIVHYMLGFDMRAGALLNLLFTLVMLCLLYKIAMKLFAAEVPALAACAIWFLSPAVVHIDLEARHYQLFGLLALCSAWLGYLIYERRSHYWLLIAFTLVNAAGFLTHYYHGFLLIPGALLMLQRHGFQKPAILYIASLFVSLGLFLAAFPDFFDFQELYLRSRLAPEGPYNFPDRVRTFFYAWLEFFTHWRSLRYLMLLLVIAGWVYLMYRFRSDLGHQTMERQKPLIVYLNITLLFWFVYTAAVYIGGIAPQQAAGEQYLSYIWPLMALSLTWYAAALIPALIASALFPIYMIQLTVSCYFAITHAYHVKPQIPAEWYNMVNGSELLITPIRNRGDLPRMATGFRPDLDILFINKPEDLQENKGRISPVTILHKKDQWKEWVQPQEASISSYEYGRLRLHLVER